MPPSAEPAAEGVLPELEVTLVCWAPSESHSAPWNVSISSQPVMATDGNQVLDLTEIRGQIACPSYATAQEIARRLKGETPDVADDRDP